MNSKVKSEVENLIKSLNLNCTIKEFQNEVYWCCISSDQNLSEDFIREFKDKVNWHCISCQQQLSEDFIREFQDRVSWDYISYHQKLSEEFIKNFKDRVNWDNICVYQKLSEDFIREFQNKVEWNGIFIYQKLSENFIREFKVDLYYISMYQKLSLKFRKEFKVKISEDNWIYKSKTFKLKKIKETKLYKVIDNKYIIAYKGIRSDNYSKYNFQYKYEVGKIYESHCDCNIDNYNSFGLSAWTLREAKRYCNEKIIKVKINIKDLGCIVHSGNKLRCHKFEVLEEVKD